MVKGNRTALQQLWFLDAQWSDLPEDVYNEVVKLWSDNELGNDNYIYFWNGRDGTALSDDAGKYPILAL